MRKEDQIIENAGEISNLSNAIETRLTLYENIGSTLRAIKKLMFTLRETAHLIGEHQFNGCRRHVDMAEMMLCCMCHDHSQVPNEHRKGRRWEPVAGKGDVSNICWECALGLSKTLSGQMERLMLFVLVLTEQRCGDTEQYVTQRG